jgi:hypothetical protein
MNRRKSQFKSLGAYNKKIASGADVRRKSVMNTNMIHAKTNSSLLGMMGNNNSTAVSTEDPPSPRKS